MFGRYAYSIAPVASLSGIDYSGSIAENFSATEIISTSASFSVSKQEEIYPSDSSSVSAVFLASLTEGSSLDDIRIIGTGYSISYSENANYGDSPTITAQFSNDISEAVHTEDFNSVNAGFVSVISENASYDDSITMVVDLYFSIIEDSGSGDFNAVITTYNIPIFEDFTPEASPIISASFISSITESLSPAADPSISGGFASSISESITVADIFDYFHYPVYVGWAPINTDISTTTEIELMFGGAPFSRIPFSGFTGAAVIVTPNWEGIDNTETAGWIPIDTDIVTTTTAKLMFGGTAFCDIPFSGFTGAAKIVTPDWQDIINN